MNVIGIHDGHNASVALFRDGKIVYALSEERILRQKNAGGIPVHALNRLLKDMQLAPGDVECIALSGKVAPRPAWYDRGLILKRYEEQCSPHIWRQGEPPKVVKENGYYQTARKLLRKVRNKPPLDEFAEKRKKEIELLGFREEQIGYLDHHACHAAAAYYGHGDFGGEILCLTNDGGGDGLCATVSVGREGLIERVAQTEQKHSFASLYARATFLMGMMPLEHEYKLMGLAPYADAERAEAIKEKLLDCFVWDEATPLTWEKREDMPPTRLWGGLLRQHFDLKRFDVIAAAMQLLIEEMAIRWVRSCIRQTGIRSLALSGGLFMNVKLNKRILELPEVNSLFVMPSCSDESNCIGAAYLGAVVRGYNGCAIKPLKDLYLGAIYSDKQIEQAVQSCAGAGGVTVSRPDNMAETAAEFLAAGEIVARYAGREEFGARALGNRSILADPSRQNNIIKINKMIKKRDFWMPFAGSMTTDQARTNLNIGKQHFAPYMIMAFDPKQNRDDFIAATHPYDETMRPQMLDEEWNPQYYRIIARFAEISGKKGGVLNTSFNLHGYPIVSSPEDAIEVFTKSGLNIMAIGSYLLVKKS
ncbi:MAG: carbamoyltransferase [Deltaproteobacteria bacterium]|nr:carbamoyltransferase [Deltaproteobacteria bacterium]